MLLSELKVCTDCSIVFGTILNVCLHNVIHNNIENLKNLVASVTLTEHTKCNRTGHNEKRKVLGTVGEFNDITRSIVHQAVRIIPSTKGTTSI